MSSATVTTVFSCNIFNGFSTIISFDDIKDLDSLVRISVKNLENHLIKYNFNILSDKLKNKSYHIHGVTLLDVFRDPESNIYICGHVTDDDIKNTKNEDE